MVPFSLRWLHAQLPSLIGKRGETLDRLYKLLDFVRSQIRIKKDLGKLEVSLSVWRKREGFVMSAIIRHHLNQKEFALCLDLMRDMPVKDPNNPVLLTKLGYVQMQFGDVSRARVSFDKVEDLMKEGKFGEEGEALTEVEMRNLVGRNKALVYLVDKDYVSAVEMRNEKRSQPPLLLTFFLRPAPRHQQRPHHHRRSPASSAPADRLCLRHKPTPLCMFVKSAKPSASPN